MDIAVHLAAFSRPILAGDMDNAAAIRFAHQLGATGVEAMDMLIRDAEIPAIKAALTQTGCTVDSYLLLCDFAQRDPFAREGQVARIRTGLERASSLGSRLMMVIPGLLKDNIEPETARRWFVEGLAAAVPAAARLGVTMTVENVGLADIARFCGTAEHIESICRDAGPAVKTTYDVGNFLMAGDDALQALNRVASRIAYVHFKDWQIVTSDDVRAAYAYPGLDDRLYLGAVLGTGVIDLPGALTRLRRLGYDGRIAVEYEGPGDQRESVRRGVDYLRTLLARDG